MVLGAAERAPCQGLVEAIKKRFGRVSTARTRLGFAAAWTCALVAAEAKSLDAVRIAKALQGFELPPEVVLMPNPPFYRAGQNQLIPTLYVGSAQASGEAPDDVFKVTRVVNGADIAGTVEESGCRDEVAGVKRPRAARFRRPSTLLIDMSADSSHISPRRTLRGDAP
jgi:hypothetical protein